MAMIDGHRSSTPTSSGSWRRTCRPASAADRPTTSYSRRTTRVGTRGSCSSYGPRSAHSTPAPSRPGSSSALDAGPRPSASWRSLAAERHPRGRAPRAGDHRRRQGPSGAESRGAPGGGKWSGRADLNGRPPAPKAGALPGCATPRPAYLTTLYRPGRRRLQSRERGRRRLPRLSQILRVVFLVKRLPAALIRRELLPVLLHQRPELRREPCFNCRSGPSRTWPS